MSAEDWPPHEPAGLDDIAKAQRILFYQRVRDLSDCERALLTYPVAAACEITQQWFSAPGGRIEEPRADDNIIGSHAMCLTGFDERTRQIEFVNSWGELWGDRGFGYLPYSYFEQRLVSSWILYGPDVSRELEYPHDINYVELGYRSALGMPVHVREVYDAAHDERLGWAIAVERGSQLDIEDYFVRPEHRDRGFGRQLRNMLDTLSKELSLPIRVWFSHADAVGDVQKHLCNSLGLTIMQSAVRWASAVAVCKPSLADADKSVPKPAKPRQWLPNRQ